MAKRKQKSQRSDMNTTVSSVPSRDEYENDHTLQKRLLHAKEELDRLTTRETEVIPGVSRLLSVREVQVIFMLSYRSTLRMIDRLIRPMQGVIKIGRRLYVHAWAVNRLINAVGKCPSCGRPWNDSNNGGN